MDLLCLLLDLGSFPGSLDICTDQTLQKGVPDSSVSLGSNELLNIRGCLHSCLEVGPPSWPINQSGRIFLPKEQRVHKTSWWQLNYVLFSTRKLGKMNPIGLYHMFQMGWFNHQPEKIIKVMSWLGFTGVSEGFFICSCTGNYKKNIID